VDPYEELNNALVGEVMRDMAENFFGTRKQVEAMIDLFHNQVKQCREIGHEVRSWAGTLNYLLIEAPNAESFYRDLDVASPDPLPKLETEVLHLPQKMPFSLSRKGRYGQLLKWAYSGLQKVCHEYNHGRYYYDPKDGGKEKLSSGYRQIEKMIDLINHKIHQVNTDIAPEAVLQCFRQFDVESREKSRILGASAGGECALNQGLDFKPLRMEETDLPRYPELPRPDQVAERIESFVQRFYPRHREPIRSRMAEMKHKVQDAD
jgi:hypothetical protein